ncbi:MAG: hypothetical protein U9R79_18155 [Armatimonadota bacterium]|nr:hypothetical protein [Armatimonadota bacterium]
MPHAGTPGRIYGDRRYVHELLLPYMKNDDLWLCPSDASPAAYGYGGADYANRLFMSYGWNCTPPLRMPDTSWTTCGLGAAKLAAIQSPSEKVAWTDVAGIFCSGLTPNLFTSDSKGYGDEVCRAGYYRHNEWVNANYCDGHAKAAKAAAVGPPWPAFVTDLWKWRYDATEADR